MLFFSHQDESHFLKNHKTVRTKAALPLLQVIIIKKHSGLNLN